MTLTGIDMEGRITNWPRVKGLGYSFATTRVVGENGAIDPDWKANVAGARSQGLVAGGYHFIAAGTSDEHCRIFKDQVAPAIEAGPFLVQLDVERPNFHPEPTYPDIAAWFAEWRRDFPTHPVIAYIPRWYITGHLGSTTKLAALTPFWWNSDYRRDIDGWALKAGGWSSPAFWQYRGTSDLAVGAKVDLNLTRLDAGALALLGRPTALPESDTEEPVGVNLDLAATHDASPLDAFGTASIVGTGHYAIRVSDGKATPIADGTALGVVQKGRAVDAYRTAFAAGEALVAYNLGGELHASPTRDIGSTFRALPASVDTTPFDQAALDKATASGFNAGLDAAAKAVAAVTRR